MRINRALGIGFLAVCIMTILLTPFSADASKEQPLPSEVNGGDTGVFSRNQSDFIGFDEIQADITLPSISNLGEGEQPWVYFGFDPDKGYGTEAGLAYQTGRKCWVPYIVCVKDNIKHYEYGKGEYHSKEIIHVKAYVSSDGSDNLVHIMIGNKEAVTPQVFKDSDITKLSVKTTTSIAKNGFNGDNISGKSEGTKFSNVTVSKYNSDSYDDFDQYDSYKKWKELKWYGTIDWTPSYVHKSDQSISLYAADQWTGFEKGTGTESDPYIIKTAFDLDQVRNNPAKCFKLGNDIDLDVAPFNSDKGWTPIDNFKGIFDGDNHKITNLFINRPTSNNCGLFGYIQFDSCGQVTFKNFSLINVDICGNTSVGGVLGQVSKPTDSRTQPTYAYFKNIHVFGKIKAVSDSVGSILGNMNYYWDYLGYDMYRCSAQADIYAGTNAIKCGGLIGCSMNATIASKMEECYFIGNLYGAKQGGALVGRGYSTEVLKNCFANATFHNFTEKVSGIMGSGWVNAIGEMGIKVDNCYSITKLDNCNNATIVPYVAIPPVNSESWSGTNPRYPITVTNCYYDKNVLPGYSFDGGKTTTELASQNIFANWDFTSVWSLVQQDSYPKLKNVLAPAKVLTEITGTIESDFESAGYSVEVVGQPIRTFTSVHGSFELNIPNTITLCDIKISKPGFLTRIIKYISTDKDLQLSPISMWAGDINGDNTINMSDIMEAAKAFNSIAGENTYNEDIDFNKDGVINMQDIIIFARNFNATSESY